jgi:uncharacterized phiE125 gp8 family phage protein
MKRILLAGPALEPVQLAEAKAHMRVDGSAEDDLVGALIAAARVAVETTTRRVLIAQSWRVVLDAWPEAGVVLPIQPVISVDVVRAVAESGATAVIPAEDYEVDATRTEVRLTGYHPASRYEIDFTAGYGASGLDAPQPLRLAIQMLVTHWYENRSGVTVGDIAGAMPAGFDALIAPYRRIALC